MTILSKTKTLLDIIISVHIESFFFCTLLPSLELHFYEILSLFTDTVIVLCFWDSPFCIRYWMNIDCN